MRLLSIIIILVLGTTVHAQIDSLEFEEEGRGLFELGTEIEVDKNTQHFLWDDVWRMRGRDTTFQDLHRFDPNRNGRFDKAYLGNIGQPGHEFEYRTRLTPGFDLGITNMSQYFIEPNEIKFYNTRSPLTNFNFASGQFFGSEEVENIISIMHTQNVDPNTNFGFIYRKQIFEGVYDQQRTNHNNAAFWFSWKPTNKSYAALVYGIYNNAKNDENGGVDTSDYFNIARYDRRLDVPVQLLTGRSEHKDKFIGVRQMLRTSTRKVRSTDDSTKFIREYKPTGFFHEFKYRQNGFFYLDDVLDSLYYGGIFYKNADSTRDKLYAENYYNRVGYFHNGRLSRGSDMETDLSLWGEYGFHVLVNDFGSQGMDNFKGGGHWSFNKPDSSFWTRLNAQYIFQGIDSGRYGSAVDLGTRGKKTGRWNLNASYVESSPSRMMEYYRANSLYWFNDFDPVTTLRLAFDYRHKELGTWLTASYESTDGLVYYDSLGYPAQLNGTADVLVGKLSQSVNFGPVYWDNDIMVQQHSADSIIDLPQWRVESSLYFKGWTFNKAAYIIAGIDAHFLDSYKGYGFDPVTGQFYVNTTELPEFYPVIDVFVNVRISDVKFFLKVEHLNEGFTGNGGYYYVRDYPMNDFNFVLGLNWEFWL